MVGGPSGFGEGGGGDGPTIHRFYDASLHQWSKGLPVGSIVLAETIITSEKIMIVRVDEVSMRWSEVGQE